MNFQDRKKHILVAIKASIEAGKEILNVYNSEDFQVEIKDDNSPLTIADKKANDIIVSHLSDIEIPILSEESKHEDYSIRKNWNYFWLVDPLDGTKEFIKKNGEFTVNIALIHNGKPIAGIIYAPVYNLLYFGDSELGGYKIENPDIETQSVEDLMPKAERLPIENKFRNYTVVGSRSHMSDETIQYFEKLKTEHGNIDIISKGSSFKLCMIAEGKADIYPRFGPTMEWDTAAGHAIVCATGGKVFLQNEKEELIYNKENLLNPWFIVKSKSEVNS